MVDFSMSGPNAALAGLAGFNGAQDRLEQVKQQAIDNALAESQGLRAQQALDLTGQRMAFDQEQAAMANERNQTVFAQQDLLFGQQQDAYAKSLADQETARLRALEAQAGLVDLRDKILAGQVSANDFAAFSTQFPELSEGLMDQWNAIAEEKKTATLSLAYQAAAALQSGNTQVAVDLLDEFATAAENSDNLQDADLADGLATVAEADPEQALISLALLMQAVDPEANIKLFGTGEGAAKTGLTPVWGTGPDGKPRLGQLTEGGSLVATTLPEGFTPDPSLAAEQKAKGTAVGKLSGEALAALPGATVATKTMDKLIQDLVDDPYLDSMLGPIDSRKMNISAASRSTQARINQLKGSSFLAAFEILKGGGQITEIEGQKATEALNRMDAATTRDEFLSALRDFQSAVYTGLEKLAAVSAATNSPGTTTVPTVKENPGVKDGSKVTVINGVTIEELP